MQEEHPMSNIKKMEDSSDFERMIKEYLKQGRDRLENELVGTREAIRLIAADKTRDFIKTMDKGLDKPERDFLGAIIMSSMYQAFCYGYGIGKIEGKTNNKVYL